MQVQAQERAEESGLAAERRGRRARRTETDFRTGQEPWWK